MVARSQTAALRRGVEWQTAVESVPAVTPAVSNDKLDLDNDSAEADLASLFETSDDADTIPFELVDRAELILLQQSDPDLSSFFELATKGDDRYSVLSGVLVRFWRDKVAPSERSIHQVVLPTPLQPKLLHIAHDILAAGHLGIAKTQGRLLQHLFWPSISCDTKSFCCSCSLPAFGQRQKSSASAFAKYTFRE